VESEIRYHPTQKPVKLLEYLIKTYTNAGDTVLDFCMGAGSTGVAALALGRKFIGIEIMENYCKIAAERLEKARKCQQYHLPGLNTT
jgi:site-specific DNA-methyltransferase (adenine-specific)